MADQRKPESSLKPTLRFQGFSDPWEQRKVGDFLTESREAGSSGDVARKLTVKLWGKGVAAKNGFDGSKHTQYYVRHAGQFIYSKLDFLNSAFGVIPEALDGYESTADLPAFDVQSLNASFLFLRVTQKDFYLKYGTIADGSRKAKRVQVDVFLDMPLQTPSLPEQALIGALFQKLDSLITLHQRKVDKLKTVKQSLLDRMFPKEGESVPVLRFAGFTDPWEQRKLGEVGYARSGVGFPDVEQGGEEGVPFYKVSDMNIPGNETDLVKSNNYVTAEQIARNAWKPVNDVPAMLFAKVGAAVFLNRKRLARESFLLDNNTMCYSFNGDAWDTDFGRSQFERIDLASLIQVGALPSYNACDVEGIEICMPGNLEEQRRIGGFFRDLDSLITLHQREVDILKNVKQGLLEKMFV